MKSFLKAIFEVIIRCYSVDLQGIPGTSGPPGENGKPGEPVSHLLFL